MRSQIPSEVRFHLRDVLGSFYLGQIHNIFRSAGFVTIDSNRDLRPGANRKHLVELYFDHIDWANPDHTRRVLQVIGLVLSQHNLSNVDSERLRQSCLRAGMSVEGVMVRLQSLVVTDWLIDPNGAFQHSQFDSYCERLLQGANEDPELAIGAAKELVEVVAKYVLAQFGQPSAQTDFPRLVKDAISCLDLSVDRIPETVKGAAATKQVLAAFNQIVGGMAELRNLYGTGHGRIPTSGRIGARHARLAVGAAITLAQFFLDTLDERVALRSEARTG